MSTALSRNSSSGLLGKLTAEIPKSRCDEDTFEEATRLAKEAGMPLAEWVRNLVMIRVWGVERVASMHADRLRVVAGIGKD